MTHGRRRRVILPEKEKILRTLKFFTNTSIFLVRISLQKFFIESHRWQEELFQELTGICIVIIKIDQKWMADGSLYKHWGASLFESVIFNHY